MVSSGGVRDIQNAGGLETRKLSFELPLLNYIAVWKLIILLV